ncbi:MAG: M1 family metallopeptidase [Actinomycetota bacterium]|nr:M1 family metallopeptidase [Actinomycetota bacterium]
MLLAARQVLVTRPGLWLVTGACVLLAALPQAAAVTVGAAGGVAFLLTGDVELAVEVWERTPGVSAPVLWAVAAAAVLGLLVWVRLYAIAVYMSRPEQPARWSEARAATTRTWRRVLLLYVHAYAVLAVAAVILSLAVSVAGPASFGTLILLGAVVFALFRTVFRIVLSMAQRAVLFDGLPALLAWRTGARFARAKRHDVAIAWVGLVAIGVSVWIGGRLVTPVLQDTAFDYPATSGYEVARQAVQLLVALPLETALLALGIAVWTAVYDEVEVRPAQRRTSSEAEPWVRKALAGALAVAIVGNGGATVIAGAHESALDETDAALAARDFKPEEIGGRSDPGPRPSLRRSAYDVEAVLEDDELTWTTAIHYLNDTGERLGDVGINVYANAYARPLRDIPFARDLVASDFNGEFQALARRGETARFTAAVDGREVLAELQGTSVIVDLPRPLGPGGRTTISLEIAMALPRFSERFGRWRDLTLLGNWIPSVAVREDGAWRLDRFGSVGDPFFSEVADYEVTLSVDENLGVVGTGSLVSVGPAPGGVRRWRFEAAKTRDAAYVVGPFLRGVEAEAGGTVVRSWYPAGRGRDGAANLETAVAAVEHFTGTYGALPWPEVEVVETEGRLGGMEYPGVVFVSSGSESFSGLPLIPDLVSYSGFEDARARYVVAHELAHQWWYAAVGNDQIEEPWLDEALAEASTRMWLEHRDDGERTWLMTNLVADAEPSRDAVRSGISDFDSNEAYTEAIYVEGAEVLMALRRTVGQATYDAILRAWYAEQAGGIGTIDELAATILEVAGGRARGLVEELF